MKYKMKMVTPEKNRIKKQFKGTVEGQDVTFKFTYSWDLDKQVQIKSADKISSVSLEMFHTVVEPKMCDEFYVLD